LSRVVCVKQATVPEFSEALNPKAGIPERNSKFSNKLYSNHLLLYWLAIQASIRSSYRRTERLIHAIICPKRTPDHSTLQKFLKRIPLEWLSTAVSAFAERVRQLWLDGTGFSQHYSRYYALRIGRIASWKRFQKAVLAVSAAGTLSVACLFGIIT